MSKVALIIARMQPLHIGHQKLIQYACENFGSVVVAIGSHNCARNMRNPFTSRERATLLEETFPEGFRNQKIRVAFVEDYLHNDPRWVDHLEEEVKTLGVDWNEVSIVGHEKDRFIYEELYPTIPFLTLPGADTHLINATAIRNMFFSDNDPSLIYGLPSKTVEFLRKFKTDNNRAYRQLREEHIFLTHYNHQWENTPFPVIFVASDAILFRNNQVLLIRRKNAPGKGLWAIPGGFVDKYEKVERAAVRELYEETGFQLIGKSVKDQYSRVFDAPNRSLRGRIISHTFLYDVSNLTDEECLIEAGDDAEEAFWYPIEGITSRIREFFYADHWEILDEMLMCYSGTG